MHCRYLRGSLSIITLVVLAPLAATGQGTNGWTGPKTPWGDPDLQGTYTNKTITPVQRPEELAGQAFLTDEEIAALEREAVERNERLLLRPALRTTVSDVDRGVDGAPGAYKQFLAGRGHETHRADVADRRSARWENSARHAGLRTVWRVLEPKRGWRADRPTRGRISS